MTASAEPRIPPRFVPTLTEVVNVPEGLLPHQQLPASPAAVPQMVAESLSTHATVEPTSQALAMPEPNGEFDSVSGGDVAVGAAIPSAGAFTAADLDAWTEQITFRLIEHFEQRLPALLEEHARLLSLAAVQELRKELPSMVDLAVRASFASADPFRFSESSERGFPGIDAAVPMRTNP